MRFSLAACAVLMGVAIWVNPVKADHWCDHLFQPSQFYVLPSHHTNYSPLHYWAPRLWNAKAYHHGLHQQSGCQYHFPQFTYEGPVRANTNSQPNVPQPSQPQAQPERLPAPDEIRYR